MSTHHEQTNQSITTPTTPSVVIPPHPPCAQVKSSVRSLRPSQSSKLTAPNPIPIPKPNLLLDRSRLKPVPKPQPIPLQPTNNLNHLIPLRSKLRSTTTPLSTTNNNNDSNNLINPNRSISAGSIPIKLSHEIKNENTKPPSDPTTTIITSTQPQINSDLKIESQSDKPYSSDLPTSPPSDQINQNNNDSSTNFISPSPDLTQHTTINETTNSSHLEDNSTLPSSSESTSPDQSIPSSSSSSEGFTQSCTQDAPQVPIQEVVTPTAQGAHSPSDSQQDEIQPWQNEFNNSASTIDHSSLERAHSAAARLDSLARLNGVSISDSSRHAPNPDALPPFLMAKYMEETQRRAKPDQVTMNSNLHFHPLPLASFPLPLPASLGFSVGPNGRGVPRLSALQRKALEKIANQQGSTATTSLTRSHTTTGAESPKALANRIQPSTIDESQERQQARSNLIRKLSSRGAHSRPKLHTQPPPPNQLPSSTQETNNEQLSTFTPKLPLSREHPEPPSLSTQGQLPEPLSPSHPSPPNCQAHPFDLNGLQISQLGTINNNTLESALQPESELMDQSQQTCVSHESVNRLADTSNVTSNRSSTPSHLDQHQSYTLRSSPLNLHNSQILPDQPLQEDPKHFEASNSDSPTPPITSPPSPVPRPTSQTVYNYPIHTTQKTKLSVVINRDSPPSDHSSQVAPHRRSFSLSDSHSALNDNQAHLSEVDADIRPTASHHLKCSGDSSTDNGIAPELLNPAPCSSTRSSIASRLMARTSLSSRIDRSLASGRATSPKQQNSPRSSVSNVSENKSDRRRSTTNGNPRTSRPSYLSTLQRFRNAPEDQNVVGNNGTNPGGATSPINRPFHHGDRPMRPTCAPPIAEAHNVVGRGLAQHKITEDLGPSQFPPTPHLVRTHMPVASAVDLARYNDHKLAPFPGLLNITPPSSPERSRSPRSQSKTPKLANHGLLSSASNFFRSPGGRSRGGSLSSEPLSANVGLVKNMETLPPSKYSLRMSHSNDEEEELVDSSRWQSMGDVAEKMSSPAPTSLPTTVDTSSYMSMISNQRREQILSRLSPFLKPPTHSTSPHSRLHDPPRRLLWHQPVLQVANSASFKDRYLFLFNDTLLITKPLLEFEDRDGERVPKLPITLEQSFLTKSVVELKDLQFTIPERQEQSFSHGADLRFKEAFHIDPSQAVQSYLGSADVRSKEYDIAKLLLSTHDLDKRQLGQYLSGPEHTGILRSYLEQLNFAFMRLEDALRAVLLSLRLPADPDAITRFLEQFGMAWTTCNPKVCLSAALATRWATAMIVLSEHLHDGLTDSMRYVAGLIGPPTKLQTEVQFVDMIKGDFVDGKSDTALPADKLDAMLKKAYQSIRRDRLVQARANIEDTEKIQLLVEEGNAKGSPLPYHLTYQVPSELITISIPKPDPKFGIKLFGPGLAFEPSFLSFSHSQTASFRIKGKAIGMRQISFVKIGRQAAAYEGLPLNAMVSVERAFMQHTVQVGFYNHLSVKRKYLLSFHGPEPEAKFIELVTQALSKSRFKSPQTESQGGPWAMSKMVAFQVLRDTLILNEDLLPMNVNPYATTTVVLTAGNRKSKTNRAQNENPASIKTSKLRSNSLSETYIHTMGKNEKDLHQAIIDRRNQAQEMHLRNKQKKILKEQLQTNLEGGKMGLNPYSCSNKDNPVGLADENQNQILINKFAKTGLNLIQHCEQNSLIPLVLGFLSMGAAAEKSGTKQMINNSNNNIGLNSYSNLGIFHQAHQNQKQQQHHLDDKSTMNNKSSASGLAHHHHPIPPSSSSMFNFAKFVSK